MKTGKSLSSSTYPPVSPPPPPSSHPSSRTNTPRPCTIGTRRCNPLRYIPVLWGAITALVLYFIVAILLTVRESLPALPSSAPGCSIWLARLI